jgi:hypothetical protein
VLLTKHPVPCHAVQSTRVLDMAEFYNDAVNEPDFNFKEDYKCWTSVSCFKAALRLVHSAHVLAIFMKVIHHAGNTIQYASADANAVVRMSWCLLLAMSPCVRYVHWRAAQVMCPPL